MIYYCPNCWAFVEEKEEVCGECGAIIEPLDQRNYFEKLVNALNHPERTTRIRAAYILGELRDRRAVQPFAQILSKMNGIRDVFFVEMIALALGKVDGEDALPLLIRLMEHPSFLVRRAALGSLGKYKSEAALDVIKKALEDASPGVQEQARRILETQ